jgi:DNA segregation ATPase FtsK/SpoIIIE, S-DNA-T family
VADAACVGVSKTSEIWARGARFYILDGTPADAPHAGFLAKLARVLPHPLQVAGWRDLSVLLAEVAGEVDNRQRVHEGEFPSIFLFVYGLQRFRELRRTDDDFGFSTRRGENIPANPANLFGTILREGPGLGAHTLIWCDNLTNVNRALDRARMREFEMKVLFQMSAADSSNLIDTPLASKLGMHRALFHSEDRGQPEKFRPYGLPSEDWLNGVKARLSAKQAPDTPRVAQTV